MLNSERQRYWRVLLDAAERLIGICTDPLDLLKLCQTLDVKIERTGLVRGKATLVRASSGPQIQLPRQNDGIGFSSFERFLIAHELGHLILARECSAAPVGKSEYWQHETLCDRFAALLLIPDRLVREPATSISKAGDILALVQSVAKTAQVPPLLAARRVCEVNDKIAIFQVTRQDRAAFRVVKSALPNGGERASKISADSGVGRALAKLGERRKEIELTEEDLADNPLSSCRDAKSGVAVLDYPVTVDLALLRPHPKPSHIAA